MTEASHYPPTASPGSNGPDTSGPVLLAVAGPTAQRRATVAFRLILAIPHLVVLYALGIAAAFVAFTGWFGALASGRLPRFAAAYLSGYLSWYGRTAAYLLLLTDQYPPFAFDDTAYPVRVAVSQGRLGRLTVLLRIILAIPAAIVSMVLVYGVSTIVVLIAWLTALVAGRLPEPLHHGFTAVLRYTIRYYGYLYLLTGVYPGGLFGDPPDYRTQAPSAYGTPDPGFGPSAGGYSGPGYGSPGYRAPGYGAPGYGAPAPGYGTPAFGDGAQDYAARDYGAPGYGAQDYAAPGYGPPDYRMPGYETPPPPGYETPPPPGYGAPTAAAPGQDAGWRLVLTPGARRFVGLILVLGLLTVAGEGAAVGTVINSAVQRHREINQLNTEVAQHNAAVARLDAAIAREQQASDQVNSALTGVGDAHDSLLSALNGPGADSTNCTTVACFNATAVPVANGFAAFGRTLRAIAIPAGSAAAAKRLSTDTAENLRDWKEITQATSFTSIESIATAAETVGGHYDDDYAALLKSLGQVESTLENRAATLDSQAAALNGQAAALNRQAKALNRTVGVRTANNA